MGIQPIPRFRDVTKVNPGNILYVSGNESTDGSIRIILGTAFADRAEKRAVGDLGGLDPAFQVLGGVVREETD